MAAADAFREGALADEEMIQENPPKTDDLVEVKNHDPSNYLVSDGMKCQLLEKIGHDKWMVETPIMEYAELRESEFMVISPPTDEGHFD